MPVGIWALDVLRNNALVGDEKLISDYKPKLKNYLENIILFTEALKKVLKETSPDIIVSNDSYYYPWSILEKLALKKNIPFYSHWIGGKKDGWCYAKDEPSMNLNLSQVWETWRNIDLSVEQNKIMKNFLDSRKTGKSMVLNTANPEKNPNSIKQKYNLNIHPDKPTALLTSNVIWDLAALNKDIQFENMIDWIVCTIDFFIKNPQWQLIIKAHPAEKNQAIPETVQLIKDEIDKHFAELPGNIIFIEPNSDISVYDLISLAKVGLVYTTTVGLEMASFEVPVVTAGISPYYDKGFTYDTKTKDEYFQVITNLLEANLLDSNAKLFSKSAKKFFYLYYFMYYMPLNIMEYSFGKNLKLKIKSLKDILPGGNPVLDYVSDSIISHLPIFSKDRWPTF
jgi:hypothetical protein